MHTVFDWDLIKREYVQGFVVANPQTGDRRIVYPSHADLGNKHGCHIDTIRHQASKQKPTWSEQRSALKAKLAEREDERRVSYYISESAGLDAETLSLVRHQLKLLRAYLEQFEPILIEYEEDDMEAKFRKANILDRFKIQDLEATSRALRNLQEIGRRAVSEPVAGVREIIIEMQNGNKKDAGELRAQIDRLQKKMQNRANQARAEGRRQKEILTKQDINN